MANVSCPHCNGKIVAEGRIAGREVGCPHCNGRVIMPGEQTPVIAYDEPTRTNNVELGSLEFLDSGPSAASDKTAHRPSVQTFGSLAKTKTARFKPIYWIAAGIPVLIIVGVIVAGIRERPKQSSRNSTPQQGRPPTVSDTEEPKGQEHYKSQAQDSVPRFGHALTKSQEYYNGYEQGRRLALGFLRCIDAGDNSAILHARQLYQERLAMVRQLKSAPTDENKRMAQYQQGIADNLEDILGQQGISMK